MSRGWGRCRQGTARAEKTSPETADPEDRTWPELVGPMHLEIDQSSRQMLSPIPSVYTRGVVSRIRAKISNPRCLLLPVNPLGYPQSAILDLNKQTFKCLMIRILMLTLKNFAFATALPLSPHPPLLPTSCYYLLLC